MKAKNLLAAISMVFAGALPVNAQYTDILEGLAKTIMPAISNSDSYKGYVEVAYTQGFGTFRTNFASLSTSQGYKFNKWFYVGAGVGVDLLWSTTDDTWGANWKPAFPDWSRNNYTTGALMVPVFTDFRFNIGTSTTPSLFLNLRAGASFLCSDSYVKVADGYLTSNSYFYFQPSIGFRIRINDTNPRQAVDIGIHYRVMTSEYWDSWQYTAAINGLGVNLSYEW